MSVAFRRFSSSFRSFQAANRSLMLWSSCGTSWPASSRMLMRSAALDQSSLVMNEMAIPVRPARPVLPTRWTYSSACRGKS